MRIKIWRLCFISISVPAEITRFRANSAVSAVQAWKEGNPGGHVIVSDLAKTSLTFVDLDWIAGA